MGEIRGIKWNDLNNDGVFNSDEPAVEGVTIYLDFNNNDTLDSIEPSTTTNEAGEYSFTELEPDDYVVREVVPTGFTKTFPTDSADTIGDGFADVVLDFFDSGEGPIPGPYGFLDPYGAIEEVDLNVVLGDDPSPGIEALSLPTNSSVTVGFTDEVGIDGPGDDIFIRESGAAGDRAEVFVSSDLVNFTSLGIAQDDTTTAFDLADINFTEPVRAVKIVGLDNAGTVPGFDVVNVQVLPESVGEAIGGHAVTLAEDQIVEGLNFGNFGQAPESEEPLEVTISSPDDIAADETGLVTITYTNTGNADLPAPLLELTASGANLSSLGATGFTEDSIQFLGLNDEGNIGVLPTGATNSLTVGFQPTQEAGEQIDFSVSIADPDESIDWQELQQDSKPDYLTDEAWSIIYDNFTASAGNTVEDYQELLAANANYLFGLGEYVADANRLVGFEFQQASDYQAISQRYALGSFGRGRSFIGDIELNVDENGNVAIAALGSSRSFELLPDSTYQPEVGDFATLNLNAGVYTLTEPDGTATVFNDNGTIDSIIAPSGYSLVADYSDGQLTNLSDSYGNSLTYKYDANGRIVTVTDSDGRITNYDYNPSGELLVSISDAAGTTTYTYDDVALTAITDANGTTIEFEYDTRGRLIRQSVTNAAVDEFETEVLTYSYGSAGEVAVTDAEGNETQLLFNANGQIGRLIDANDRSLDFNYDRQGNLTQIITSENNTTLFGYDERGNLTSQVDAADNLTTFTYEDTFNRLTGFSDPRGNGIDYSYDESGNLTTIDYEDGSSETFEYDNNGNVTVSVNRRGQEILYSYDNKGQLVSQINPDADVPIEYTYDERGNLDTVTDVNGTIELDYDKSDRLTKIAYPGGRFLEYTYDAGDRRTSMTDSEGNVVNYSYDNAGRLASLTDGNEDLIVSYEYDAIGRLAREDKGNGTYTLYSYDLVGQLLSIENYAPDDTLNSSSVYTYDTQGRQISLTTLDGEWTYSYDAISQLTGAEFVSTNPDISDQNLTYEYDAAGNRISKIEDGETTDYTTDNLNQYTDVNGFEYQYDADGNLVSKTIDEGTFLYVYNSENQLSSVTAPNGTVTSYEYDPFGNRIASVVDGERTEYLIDPFGFGDVVGEYDADGNLTATYAHGIGLETITDPEASYYYDFNAVGSTVGLTDVNGEEANSYFYEPFGDDISETEAVTNPFEFVGQYGVAEEANGLDFMRARFYDSDTGRFISPDPIGLNGGDTNLYRYVENNSIDKFDPIGLKTFGIGFGVVGGAGSGGLIEYQVVWDDNSKWWNPNILRTVGGGGYGGVSLTFPVSLNFTDAKSVQDLTKEGIEGSVSLAVLAGAVGGSIYTNPKREFTGRSYYLAPVLTPFIVPHPEISVFGTYTEDLGTPVDNLRDFLSSAYNNFKDFANRTAESSSDLVDSVTNSINSFKDKVAEKVTDLLNPEESAMDKGDKPNNQARSKGEPHLTTFDGVGYDFQAAGEFTLVESLDNDLNIQVRYVQIDDDVTVASAVATEVDGQNVVIDSEGIEFVDAEGNIVEEGGIPRVSRSSGSGEATVIIDGEEVEIASGDSIDVGNSRIYRSSDEYTIVYAGEDGELNDSDDQLVVNYFRPGTINIVDVYLGDEKQGQITGLLGNLNDNPDDDVALRDGTVLPRPLEFDRLYGDYLDDYRVTSNDESLFTYEQGQNPNTFYNPDFPTAPYTYDDLPSELKAKGDAAALAAGYEPGTFAFKSAAFDFAVTNDSGFLEGVGTKSEVAVSLPIIDKTAISIDNVSLAEGDSGNTEFIFTVSLEEASDATITVDYVTADGTATAGEDYTATEGTLKFAPDETEKTFSVEVIGDTEVEKNETFTINLSNAVNSTLSNDRATGTLENDDSEPEARGSTVYRFFNPTAGVHFYTADKKESDYVLNNLDNYDYEGESYVTVDPLTGNDAEEVYRFFNSTTGVHLYTTDETERDYIIDNLDNFAYEDVKFYAYETETEGTIPIYRFYEPTIGVHFYTPDDGEKTYVEDNLSNYTYEGIAYYAFPIDDV